MYNSAEIVSLARATKRMAHRLQAYLLVYSQDVPHLAFSSINLSAWSVRFFIEVSKKHGCLDSQLDMYGVF